MTNRTKLILGAVAGAAVGVGLIVAFSENSMVADLKDTLADASDKITDNLKDLLEENKDMIAEWKQKATEATEKFKTGIPASSYN